MRGSASRSFMTGVVAAVAAAAMVWAAPVTATSLEVWVAAPGQTPPPLSDRTSLPRVTAEPGADTTLTSAPQPDSLVASFGLRGILDPEEENPTLGEGVPATLTIVVDLWRKRSGWWDSLVRSRTYVYRFRRDVWRGTYDVLNPDRSSVTLADPVSLRVYLERVHELPLGTADRFEPGKAYYVTVKAVLQPLDLDDLEEVEAWLNGDVTQGAAKGGILGVPKALYRLAVDLSGLGTKSAVGRSGPFLPRP